jgi:peptidoglycan/LPS O-acetylase OafA/YrhL
MNRIFGLDLLRAISIFLVLIQHQGWSLLGLSGPFQIGSFGVEIFFVLSGFLIGTIIIRDLSKDNSFPSIRKFWVRRWFRILPLYYLVLLFKFICIDHSVGYNLLYYIFFLQNNFYGIRFLSVSWSLVIEEWFYLFSPIFLFLAIRLLQKPKSVLAAILFFLLFENIIRFIYVYHGNVPFAGVNSSFPFRFDSLFLGVLLAHTKFYSPSFYGKLQSKYMMLAGLLLISGYLCYISVHSIPNNQIDMLLFPRTLGFLFLSFGITLIIPFFDGIKSISQSNWAIRSFYLFITYTSVLTYSIYLIHIFVSAYYGNQYHLFLEIPLLQFLWRTAITYLFAFLVYKYFEKPVLDLRERFS